MTDLTSSSDLDIKIKHRQWASAFKNAFAVLSMASPGDVVCIVGPSRAGKTRLVQELRKNLESGNLFSQTGLLPVVSVEAVNAGPNGTFSTKAFIQRMLEAVRHPMLSMDNLDDFSMGAAHKVDRSTEATLRLALERALRHRGCRYLFIDEAQHARYASKQSQAPHAVMDSWKCLAQTSGLVLVLVGAYPILEVLRHSPHMLGRKTQIHLPRYGNSKEDMVEFARIISAFEHAMGSYVEANFLVRHAAFLHERTCGCIGLLKGCLKNALTIAQINQRTIDIGLLEASTISDSDMLEISREIAEGERLLFSSPRAKKQISSKSSRTPVPKKKKGEGPFRRKPARYAPGHRIGDET
tara:strand:- start:712 stop:1773 length:1062 start_codon:yes stop_codon:yes gene_type:complete